jgi:3-hydroxybutyryl-CoA dehydrogenase
MGENIEIKKVGVVGCGVMGSGIAGICAQCGYDVTVSEISEKLLRRGLRSIDVFLNKSVEKGKISEQAKISTLDRIKGTTNIEDFCDRDLVIEAVAENIGLKKRVFAQLDKVCTKACILTSNTSVLSITDIAMVTLRPDRVLGLHFFNPAPLIRLLEIVKTIVTSDETFEIGRNFGESLGKTVVIAQDTPGFIVNRLLSPFLLNAIRMLEAGMATREDIDNGVKLGLNHPMGPLALADLVGIDTVLFASDAMYEQTKDPQYTPPVLLRRMVAAGWLGHKTGKGFYEY